MDGFWFCMTEKSDLTVSIILIMQLIALTGKEQMINDLTSD